MKVSKHSGHSFSRNKYALLLAVILFLTFVVPVSVTNAAGTVLNNGKLRFGDGSASSIDDKGNLLQPFYYGTVDGVESWFQLTYSSYPLDNAVGLGGDGTESWNQNGVISENPVLENQVIDTSGYISTGENTGYGTVVSTGNITINDQVLEVRNTYNLGQDASFVKIDTRITNQSSNPVTNLRFWTGTRDDFIGNTDRPTKQRGNLGEGGFKKITSPEQRAGALQIFSGDTGVLFYSPSDRANVSINSCCSFANSTQQNPADSQIEATNDGSYALFIRMNDLAVGGSDQFTWYYAAGDVSRLGDVAEDVANEEGAGSEPEPTPALLLPPGALTTTAGDREVQLTWGTVTGATYYNIYRGTSPQNYDEQPIATVRGNTYRYTATGLTNGTPYYFVIRSGTAQGQSNYSDEVMSTPQALVPEAPVLRSPIPGNSSVNLSWSAVDNATEYAIYSREESDAFGSPVTTVSGSVYNYNVANLTNGTTYYFAVKALNESSESDISNQASATPFTAPGAPTGVRAQAGDQQVTISFAHPSNTGGNTIAAYEVTVSPGGRTVIGTQSPIVVSGLTNGESYTFTVRALSSGGNSELSDISNTAIPIVRNDDDDDDKKKRSSGSSGTPGTNSTPETVPAAPTPTRSGTPLEVNGVPNDAATTTTNTNNGQTASTVTFDDNRLRDILTAAGNGALLNVPVFTGADVVNVQLKGTMLKTMQEQQTTVQVQTKNAQYKLPVALIDSAALASRLGTGTENITLQIGIAVPTAEMSAAVNSAASSQGFNVVGAPVTFTVTGTYGEQTAEITQFNAYVERSIALPEGTDHSRITTGVVVNSDGTVRHVPTQVALQEGTYYAQINSLTNSTYALIWNPREFPDVAQNWSKEIANDMGSRKVVEGNNNNFQPGLEITRAEFAAIMVRGLGIQPTSGSGLYQDVAADAWYSGYVGAAQSYGLINGFQDGTFRPNDKITREQAMVIISKAMQNTGLTSKIKAGTSTSTLSSFADANKAGAWASTGINASLQSGIVSGRTESTLAPKAHITRAEAAAMVSRLLRNAGLI